LTKRIIILVLSVFLCVLSGCRNDAVSSNHSEDKVSKIDEILNISDDLPAQDTVITGQEENIPDSDTGSATDTETVTGIEKDTEEIDDNGKEADVDLTVMSSTLVYSEVYRMMMDPDAYIGKTVKMQGAFYSYYDEELDKYYFSCIIEDATACCAQGIEFELTDNYTYPDDYPEEGGSICVTGVFDTYEEYGITYCTLKNARKL